MVASSMLETREYHGPEPGSPPPPLAALRRVSHRSEHKDRGQNMSARGARPCCLTGAQRMFAVCDATANVCAILFGQRDSGRPLCCSKYVRYLIGAAVVGRTLTLSWPAHSVSAVRGAWLWPDLSSGNGLSIPRAKVRPLFWRCLWRWPISCRQAHSPTGRSPSVSLTYQRDFLSYLAPARLVDPS